MHACRITAVYEGCIKLAEYILKTEGLCKDFIGLRAIDNLDIAVNKGDVHGLIGPNGSGKTTLLDVMSALLRPSTGEVLINSKKISNMDDNELAKVRGKTISRT